MQPPPDTMTPPPLDEMTEDPDGGPNPKEDFIPMEQPNNLGYSNSNPNTSGGSQTDNRAVEKDPEPGER